MKWDQQSYKIWLKRNSSFYKEKCIVFEAGADDTFHANGKMLLKYHNGIHRIGQSPPKSGQNHLAAKNLNKITSENSFLVELNFFGRQITGGDTCRKSCDSLPTKNASKKWGFPLGAQKGSRKKIALVSPKEGIPKKNTANDFEFILKVLGRFWGLVVYAKRK